MFWKVAAPGGGTCTWYFTQEKESVEPVNIKREARYVRESVSATTCYFPHRSNFLFTAAVALCMNMYFLRPLYTQQSQSNVMNDYTRQYAGCCYNKSMSRSGSIHLQYFLTDKLALWKQIHRVFFQPVFQVEQEQTPFFFLWSITLQT